MKRVGLDANHREIVRALQAVGATVLDLAAVGGGAPDLAVGYRGKTFWLEVKDGAAKDKRQRKPRANQVEWHRWWRGDPVMVVLSVDEALAAIGAVVRRAS